MPGQVPRGRIPEFVLRNQLESAMVEGCDKELGGGESRTKQPNCFKEQPWTLLLRSSQHLEAVCFSRRGRWGRWWQRQIRL